MLFWPTTRQDSTQRFTHTLRNVFKKTAVAYGADLLAIELNGEVVSGLPGNHSLENLLLSWARRVVGDDLFGDASTAYLLLDNTWEAWRFP